MTTIRNKRRREPREMLKKIGAGVMAYRRERGLSRQELAERIHFSVEYVTLIERGARNPPYTTMIAIARVLGVHAADLLGEKGRPGHHRADGSGRRLERRAADAQRGITAAPFERARDVAHTTRSIDSHRCCGDIVISY